MPHLTYLQSVVEYADGVVLAFDMGVVDLLLDHIVRAAISRGTHIQQVIAWLQRHMLLDEATSFWLVLLLAPTANDQLVGKRAIFLGDQRQDCSDDIVVGLV